MAQKTSERFASAIGRPASPTLGSSLLMPVSKRLSLIMLPRGEDLGQHASCSDIPQVFFRCDRLGPSRRVTTGLDSSPYSHFSLAIMISRTSRSTPTCCTAHEAGRVCGRGSANSIATRQVISCAYWPGQLLRKCFWKLFKGEIGCLFSTASDPR